MTDERDKEQVDGATPPVETPEVVDDWTKAFAALEAPVVPADESDQGGPVPEGPAGVPGGVGADGVPAPAAGAGAAPGDAGVGADDVGGSLPPAGGAGDVDDESSVVDVEATVTALTTNIKQQAIDEMAEAFATRKDDSGALVIRQSNGRLGATINDPDIYKVDPATGAPAFYNPDTGLPFTGDNPRAQAKAWVADYNEELRDTFNRLTEDRENELMAESQPVIDLMKFVPTYEGLDPVRQKMFDALIEGYEVEDAEGNHIGYSVDLNQTLARVNDMVERIKGSQAAPPATPTGPALDMPNSGSADGQRKEPKNVAEALEMLQDQQLADGKKK